MNWFGNRKVSAYEARQLAERYLDQYGNMMLRFAYTYLKNKEDAEDVVQDALIKAIGAAASFENETHEKSYLLKVVKNCCLDVLRKQRNHLNEELDENVSAEEKEDLSFVREAVGKLPQNEREAIHLYYEEGYSTKEIAKLLGRKETTVRSDMMRGRNHLKAILKEEYDFE